MKIAVCVKRVPDMEMRFAIAADRRSLDPAGLKYEMGDFDGYGVEIALQLVEKAGSGEVAVISLGPDGVQEILRKALAMGATRAVQLKADEVPFDGLTIARALAAELKDGGYDLILFGRDIVVEEDLEVPHPRFRDRFFVLGPLAEIAPDMVDPVTGLRVGELLRDLLRDTSR